MTKKKHRRKQHSEEFKAEALRLAEKFGVTQGANQLSLHGSQIYQWRAALERKATTSERESSLATENARLKRMLSERDQKIDIRKRPANTSTTMNIAC